jgi:hypothetical protein
VALIDFPLKVTPTALSYLSTSVFHVRDFSDFVSGGAAFRSQSCNCDFKRVASLQMRAVAATS